MMDKQSSRHSPLCLRHSCIHSVCSKVPCDAFLQNNPVELREGGRLRFAASSRTYVLQQNVDTLATTSDSKLPAGDVKLLILGKLFDQCSIAHGVR